MARFDSPMNGRNPRGRFVATVGDSWLAQNFQTLIMQPTTLCNLDCGYCYLPQRHQRLLMSTDTASSVATAMEVLPGAGAPVSVVWHGGEPLATNQDTFRKLLEPFEPLRQRRVIRHYVQTNATLINETWCDLLQAYDFAVGVSIDGPASHNLERVDRRGRPAFDRIERGMGVLRRRGIPFSLIAVITKQSIEHAASILDYLTMTGCWSIGFNIEEIEGDCIDVRERRSPEYQLAKTFWQSVISWDLANGRGVRIREVERLAHFHLAHREASQLSPRRSMHDPIPTVAWDGSVTLLSPELAGFSDKRDGTFVAGNVSSKSLLDIVHDAHKLWYVEEFGEGVRRCKEKCRFFDYCLGGHASNKYFENGDLSSTETAHCRNSIQALVLAMSDLTEATEGE